MVASLVIHIHTSYNVCAVIQSPRLKAKCFTIWRCTMHCVGLQNCERFFCDYNIMVIRCKNAMQRDARNPNSNPNPSLSWCLVALGWALMQMWCNVAHSVALYCEQTLLLVNPQCYRVSPNDAEFNVPFPCADDKVLWFTSDTVIAINIALNWLLINLLVVRIMQDTVL